MDPVRSIEGLTRPIGIRGTSQRVQRYISATGRTSTEPNLAEGTMAAAFSA
jgi:hypothetical protein